MSVAAQPPRFLPLRPGWPLTGILLLYPLWWALGLGVLIFPIAAVPMVVILVRQRRSGRPIALPPGFAVGAMTTVPCSPCVTDFTESPLPTSLSSTLIPLAVLFF